LALDASPQARACRDAFVALLEPLALLAAGVGNLERLGAEYRRTERRARALENVLLPEIETALRRIEGHLELADQEEAARIRLAGRHR
jgi:V/A-type H+/Na+-transporting ATPase subunit D